MTPSLTIDMLGGNCPVQAEGRIDGTPFYFRARGSAWSFSVGEDAISRPDWSHQESYGDGPFDAGWMSDAEARSFIQKAAILYRNRHDTSGGDT